MRAVEFFPSLVCLLAVKEVKLSFPFMTSSRFQDLILVNLCHFVWANPLVFLSRPTRRYKDSSRALLRLPTTPIPYPLLSGRNSSVPDIDPQFKLQKTVPFSSPSAKGLVSRMCLINLARVPFPPPSRSSGRQKDQTCLHSPVLCCFTLRGRFPPSPLFFSSFLFFFLLSLLIVPLSFFHLVM